MAPASRTTANSKGAAMDPPDTSSQLELILAKLTALESLPSKVESLEKLLLASNARADSLQQQLTVKDKIICDLQAKTNSLEQYNRGWSIRLNNIPLPDHDQTDTYTVMKTVFDKALKPIFEGAIDRGMLAKMPAFDEVLETAHILPAKSNDRPKPIIARFYSRNIRSLVFRLKKELAPTTTINTKSGERKKVLLYPIYEDLTKTTHTLLQALLNDPRTGPVWTIGGSIRFRLKDDNTVRKVVSVFDSIEVILNS
jgi:hypothetical protein